jgi:hypothetical protein
MLDITPSSITKRGPILKDFKHELCQNEPLDIAGQYLRGIDGDRNVTGSDRVRMHNRKWGSRNRKFKFPAKIQILNIWIHTNHSNWPMGAFPTEKKSID